MILAVIDMNMYDLILKKREGGRLRKDEIDFFINGYTDEGIPDYQVSALLMTFFFNELDHDEIFYLTDAMKNSGDIIDLSAINGIKVDKHSTGGVGDKTTLIVAPLAAACGVPIAKMSGRGLGFTGGTVDKMESIPGMKTSLTESEFKKQVNDIGISVIGQTGSIAPADKKIYALRDVTATVDNLGLIASSVMSKKLAAGSDAIILDVKCGNGAFMETEDAAVDLGRIMVEIGRKAGKKTIAVITDMNQPLGKGIGNSIEVMEAIEALKGEGPEDITNLSIELGTQMVMAGEIEKEHDKAKGKVLCALESGAALDKFKEFVKAQGGDTGVVEDFSLFGLPAHDAEIKAETAGYISEIKAGVIGMASQRSGAGRATKDDVIDLNAGIILNKKVGDKVDAGQLLATIYAGDKRKLYESAELAKTAFNIKKDPPIKKDLIIKIIE